MREVSCISVEQLLIFGRNPVFPEARAVEPFSFLIAVCPVSFAKTKGFLGGEIGEAVSVEELYQHFLSLEKLGCHNINLVTGEHYLPGILEAIRLAKKRGFSLPFVWNCSGYQSSEVLASCEGLINIYLFDFKYIKEDTALRYSKAKDYPVRAKEALAECIRQCPELEYKEGLFTKRCDSSTFAPAESGVSGEKSVKICL